MAMAFRSLIDGLHERLAARGYGDIRPAYGFVLLSCRQAPMSVGDVATLLGFTKQAASKLVDNMESDGYVRRVAHESDARARRVQLTAKGRRALTAVESIYAELESGWADVIGERKVEDLRRALDTVLRAQNDGELPAVRPTF
ncbi:MAG: MarR family transcriptional regulator [Myxococcales bacterium]|nr:MarR family transcriptional regulator [Myxococcales bacterium]MCB9583441.1 MarR family transcriptional regulator [Polyangiaceae bacterium]